MKPDPQDDGQGAGSLRELAEKRLRTTPALSQEPASREQLQHELGVYRYELEMQNEALCLSQIKLEEARDRYIDLFESAPIGYLILNRDGVVTQCNHVAAGLLSSEQEQLNSHRFTNHVFPADEECWQHYFIALLNSAGPLGRQLRLKSRDGSILNVAISGVAQCASGTDGDVLITLTDITALKNLESELAERTEEADARASALAAAERFSRAVVDSLLCRLCVIDGQGEVVASNKAWQDFARGHGESTGCSTKCIGCLAIPWAIPCWPASTSEAVEKAIAEMQAGRRMNYTLEFDCREDGHVHWYLLQISRFSCEGPVRLVLAYYDITERKLTQQRLEETAERLKQLTLHLDSVREEQNALIARELHDELGANLTMLKLGIATVADQARGSAEIKSRLDDLLAKADTALQVVRRVSSSLRPATLDTLGLVATIRWYSGQFSATTGIATTVRLPDYVRLSPAGSTTVFRIIQEGLTNVARHAEASRATINVRKHAGETPDQSVLVVRLVDNGKGFVESAPQPRDAFGVMGMRERANSLGGSLAIRSEPGRGTRLTLCIPLAS